MFRVAAVTVFVVVLMGGCAGDRQSDQAVSSAASESSETSKDTFALGTAVTADGAVPAEATGETFSRGGEVFLSINVAGASTEQEIEVEWVGPNGAVLRRDAAEIPTGSAYAAFSSGETRAWTPGQHRAVVTINGRKVSERLFAVM